MAEPLDDIAAAAALINARVPDARVQLDELLDVNDDLVVQVAAKASEVAGLQLRVDDLRAENAALLKRIADILNNPPPPPPQRDLMSVGAIIGAQCHTVPQFIAEIGTPMMRRYFAAGQFDVITNNPTVRADLGRWERFISYKPPSLTVDRTALHRCLASAAEDGVRTFIACQNEPERSDKNTDPVAWRRYLNTFIDETVRWVDSAGVGGDVFPAFTFSYWKALTQGPEFDVWWPTTDALERAVFGIQPYDPYRRKTLREQTERGVDRWMERGGKLWGMSEVNTKRTGADAATWWDDGLEWAASRGGLFALAYDDVQGQDGPWCITDPAARAALGDLMENPPLVTPA